MAPPEFWGEMAPPKFRGVGLQGTQLANSRLKSPISRLKMLFSRRCLFFMLKAKGMNAYK